MVSRGDIAKHPAWIVNLENSQIYIFRKALALRGKWFLFVNIVIVFYLSIYLSIYIYICVCVCVCVCV